VVTIALNADQQSEVKAGDKVMITLPDGSTTPGVVSSVGKVAKGTGSSATVTVLVALTHPKAGGHLDQAPVTVAITTGSVDNVLVVPVNALLARPGGGYAVEVISPAGHHLVRVSVGVFDDAAGLVQVSGSGLVAGQHVVVPAL
jgi:multidrug efflux pump subunit AcrA (membrane-fusion protein)